MGAIGRPHKRIVKKDTQQWITKRVCRAPSSAGLIPVQSTEKLTYSEKALKRRDRGHNKTITKKEPLSSMAGNLSCPIYA